MVSKEDALNLIRKDFVSVKREYDAAFKVSRKIPTPSSLNNRTRKTGIINSLDIGTVYSIPSIIKAGLDDDFSTYFYARVVDVFPLNNCVILFECDEQGTPAYVKGNARVFEGYLAAFLNLAERHDATSFR